MATGTNAFSVMNVNLCFLRNDEFSIDDTNNISMEYIRRKISEEKPQVIFIQGDQHQIKNIDSIIQPHETQYSHYSRLTKRGFAAVVVDSRIFEIEILNREHLKHGKPEDRRNVFNGLSCVQLYHKKLECKLLVSSWGGNLSPYILNSEISSNSSSDNNSNNNNNNNATHNRIDDSYLLTTIMKRTSGNKPWLIGGCFTDNENFESKFLIGINKTSKHKLCVDNISSSAFDKNKNDDGDNKFRTGVSAVTWARIRIANQF